MSDNIFEKDEKREKSMFELFIEFLKEQEEKDKNRLKRSVI